MTTERTVLISPYNNLSDQVKAKVVDTFRGWLNEVYKILVFKKQIHEMFEVLNCLVEFYVVTDHPDGVPRERKLFRIDDSDERLAKFLADQFAIASKSDPQIMDKILVNMIKRNEGDDRLRIK